MVPTLCPQFIELAIHSKMIKSIEMIYIFVIACSRNRNRSDRTIICICACRNGVRCHFNRLLHWNVASVAYILCGTWELILHTEAKITNDENVKSINDGMQTHLVAVQCTFTQAQTHSRHISGICVCVCVYEFNPHSKSDESARQRWVSAWMWTKYVKSCLVHLHFVWFVPLPLNYLFSFSGGLGNIRFRICWYAVCSCNRAKHVNIFNLPPPEWGQIRFNWRDKTRRPTVDRKIQP